MRSCLALILVATLLAACDDDKYGTGIGRPPFDPEDRPEPLPLVITEVYAATTGGADTPFVEIAGQGSQSVALAGLELCHIDTQDCVELPAQSVSSTARVTVDATSLELFPSAGDIAVVDGKDVVHAFLAWGSDPSILSSPHLANAVMSGVTEPGEFVPIPFPMPEGVAVAREGSRVGCALPSEETAATIDDALCLPGPPMLRVTEILPQYDDGVDSWVEILPVDLTGSLSLYGVRICAPPSCGVFVDATTITVDQRLVVHLGAAAPEDGPPEGHVYLPDAAPVPAVGEVAILAPGSVSLDDPDALLSFVRYGDEAGPVTVAATTGGLWTDAEETAREPRIAGESLSAVRDGGIGVSAWNPTPPTPGVENPDITPANDVWKSCSYPKAPGPESDLVILWASRVAPSAIAVANRGDTAIALGDTTLTVETTTFVFDAADLEPETGLVIELNPGDGCSGDEDLCWDDLADFPSSGEASLRIAGTLVQYLQWGDGTTDGTVLEAHAADLWPLKTNDDGNIDASCAAPALELDTYLELDPTRPGQSPPDWLRIEG